MFHLWYLKRFCCCYWRDVRKEHISVGVCRRSLNLWILFLGLGRWVSYNGVGYQSETFLSCCPSYLAVTSDSKHEIRNIVSYPFMGGFLCCFGFSSGLYLFEAPLVYTETLKMKKRNVDPKSYGPFSFFFGKVHLLQSCQKKQKGVIIGSIRELLVSISHQWKCIC